jgi:hypothetical protein
MDVELLLMGAPLLYDVTLSGVRLFTCGWYRVDGEKIQSLKVVFDPRPVFAQKAA